MNIIFGIKRFVLQLSNFFAIPVWIVRCCTLQQRGGGDVRCEVERVLCRLKSGLAWTDWPALHKLLTIIRVLSPALPSSQQPHRGNRSAGLLHHISTRPGPVRHETKQAVRFSIGIHHYQVIKCISVSNINIWKPYESKKHKYNRNLLELGAVGTSTVLFCWRLSSPHFQFQWCQSATCRILLLLDQHKKLQSLSLSLSERRGTLHNPPNVVCQL